MEETLVDQHLEQAALASSLAPDNLVQIDELSDSIVYEIQKRFFDIVGASIGLIIFAPLFILIAMILRITSPGPVLYVHQRVGKGGKRFRCYKLRTMVVNAHHMLHSLRDDSEHQNDKTFKMRNDPRVTRVGSFLRRYSLDEVPQLINVFLGDMSLVGPRPPIPSEVALYSEFDLQRLRVKPGLTCIWQVSGRSDLAFPKQLELDLEYIRRRCILLDLWLLLCTVPAVLSARGAY